MPKFLVIGLLIPAFAAFFFLGGCKEGKPTAMLRQKDAPSADFDKAIEEEARLLQDPRTKRIPPGIRELELAQARSILLRQTAASWQSRTAANSYSFQGPDNLGGRTRCLRFDVSDPTGNTLLSGSVSGAVYRSGNGGATWQKVHSANQYFSVTALAQDTRPGFTQTWYFGGGEGIGNSASVNAGAFYFGDGLYKSSDGGFTWFRLPSSNTGALFSFDDRADLIYRVAVHPITGDVYMACAGAIRRSQDGGATWVEVIGAGATYGIDSFTDVVISSTGKIYVAFGGTNTSAATNGVWVSNSGNLGSFSQIAGSAIASPAGWNGYGAYGRVVLALAPSNENLLYALYDNAFVSTCSNPAPEAELFRWNETGAFWTDLSATLPDEPGCSFANDPFSVHRGYNLCVAVKPNDANTVLIGGTNAYRSTDAGQSWTRIGGYADPNSYDFYPNHHPDIHAFAFSPSNANQLYTCSDGGLHRGDVLTTPVNWTALNNGFRTFQYYHVAISQDPAANDFIGGAQDNGTTVGLGGNTIFTQVLGGDGVSVGWGKGPFAHLQFAGAQNGIIYRRNKNFAPDNIEADLTPAGVSSIFVTYFYLDPDNTSNLYYAGQTGGANKLLRLNNAPSAVAANWQTFDFSFPGYIRAMATTRGLYSNTNRLYIGTDAGYLFRLTNPANTPTATVPVDITPSGMVGSGTLLGLSVNPTNHNELLAVYSNYNTISIWHTTTAGNASPIWSNIEGNLTLPSVRCALIVNGGSGTEYFVGTSVGLFKTTAPNGGATVWTQEAVSELGNSVVTSLHLRTADNTFAIGTHGTGMWKGVVSAPLPVRFLTFAGQRQGRGVQLQWTTENEQDNRGFQVERSSDGRQFVATGFVAGRGFARQAQYRFFDAEVPEGDVFYRLRQLDVNGAEHFSTIILLKAERPPATLQVFGNPFSNQLQLALPTANGPVAVSLVSMSGQIVFRKSYASNTRIVVEHLAHLLPGTYMLQVLSGTEQWTERVIKQ